MPIIFHPAVPAALFSAIIALAMFGISPGLAAISLGCAFAHACLTTGLAQALSKLKWQLPLLALICLINPLFSAMGSTLLARVGPFRIYAESVAYGAVMGALLVSVLMWIEAFANAVGQDELLSMGGSVLPRASLAVSMVARLVPQLMKRGAQTRRAYAANAPGAPLDGARAGARVMSSLLSWSLEDSVERADSMRARGWGAGAKRSSYSPQPFRTRDGVALAAVVLLAACAAWGVYLVQTGWRFYPRMEGSASWLAYLPFALLCLSPSAYAVWSRLAWEVGA